MPKINDPQINSLNTLDGSELLYAVKDVTDNNVTMQVVKEFCNDGGSNVTSVNGQIGDVVLDADDVGATTQVYVDTQDNLIINSLTLKADTNYVDTQDGLLQDQIDLKADAIAVNQVLSTKADLVGGVIPSYQLPSYVDDVLNFTDLASFPSLGEDGKIYVAEDANKTYRWSGSSYVESGGGGVALGETSSTAYRGDNGKIAYDHTLSQGNPHNATTSDINEGTKLFFTGSRVNQTPLTGLDTSVATPALATDQLLAAIGKLQAQINNMGSGGSSGGITWVDVTTIAGTAMPSVGATLDLTRTKIYLAKKDGQLWIKGYFQLAANIPSPNTGVVFRITDPNWFVDVDHNIQNFPATFVLYHPINTSTICFIQLNASQMDFVVRGNASSVGWTYGINPTCIGKAK